MVGVVAVREAMVREVRLLVPLAMAVSPVRAAVSPVRVAVVVVGIVGGGTRHLAVQGLGGVADALEQRLDDAPEAVAFFLGGKAVVGVASVHQFRDAVLLGGDEHLQGGGLVLQ